MSESNRVRSKPPAAAAAARFPRAHAYLSSLPFGLKSFPECRARVAISEAYARDHGAFAKDLALPEPLASLLAGQLDPQGWVPEVAFQVVQLMVRDARFSTDKDFLGWTYGMNRELFDKPFIRTFMRLLSPTLIVVGSAKRWASFHEGSRLEAGKVESNGSRARTTATVFFPAGLFPRPDFDSPRSA